MHFGLLGFPLGHSFSAKYFAEKFSSDEKYSGWDYKNFEREDVKSFFENEAPKLDGFNVTIPHKRNVIPFLSRLSDEARKVGAVNCVKNTPNGFTGYNTDVFGFEESLLSFLKETPEYALILGSGGASLAVRYVLEKNGIRYDIVSRTGEVNYSNVSERIREAGLIVNTTPLGMYPKIEGKPDLDYSLLRKNQYLYDVVYNPLKTSFLKEGEKMGCKIKSGIEMLELQAKKSLDIWTSSTSE